MRAPVALLLVHDMLVAAALYGPPVGAMYEGRVRVPIVGTQHVHLLVTTRSQGQVTLSGLLSATSSFAYAPLPVPGSFSITFAPALQQTLARHRIRLTDATYDNATDRVCCCVSVRPFLFMRRVHLRRHPTPHAAAVQP